MTTQFVKERQIKYLNRDFHSLKRDLVKFSQAHHSGVFQDFNEASPGMAVLELCAYVGDVLSFYQDMQFNELKRETAQQIDNVVSFAKQQGYRPSGKRAARGVETFMIEVPATTIDGAISPDDTFSPIMLMGAQCGGPNGTLFETLDAVDFSSQIGRLVTGSRFDPTTGLPTHFALRKDVDIIAGETKVDTIVINDFEPFKTIELSNADVIEVISVVDSDGNDWVEVDYLPQSTVFDFVTNPGTDSDVVPYILRLVAAPRRFITDRDPLTSKTKLIFGSGDGINFDDDLIPNIADLALELPGRRNFTTFSVDPQNFLKTKSMGLSPFNTTLTVTYRVGGGQQTNVPPLSIRNVVSSVLTFSSTSLDPQKKGEVESSLECINISKTEGGGPEETIAEVKANGGAFFAAQNRAVSREDYIVRVLTIPEKFGKPEKVYVKRAGQSALALDIHILSKDADGFLTKATSTLKSNIKTYLTPFRMLTDGVNILDSEIINLRCEFGIVVSSKMNRTEVLAGCLGIAKSYLDTANMQIGQPIVVSQLMSQLQQVIGVVSVYKLEFTNAFGTIDGLVYSDTRADILPVNNILYCPDNSIFEVKYPNRDIVGVAK